MFDCLTCFNLYRFALFKDKAVIWTYSFWNTAVFLTSGKITFRNRLFMVLEIWKTEIMLTKCRMFLPSVWCLCTLIMQMWLPFLLDGFITHTWCDLNCPAPHVIIIFPVHSASPGSDMTHFNCPPPKHEIAWVNWNFCQKCWFYCLGMSQEVETNSYTAHVQADMCYRHIYSLC